jgi:hypothetical protein
MTLLESRLSKLEASISPSRPQKLVTIRCCRDEDSDAARDRHFAAHPEDRDAEVLIWHFHDDEETTDESQG